MFLTQTAKPAEVWPDVFGIFEKRWDRHEAVQFEPPPARKLIDEAAQFLFGDTRFRRFVVELHFYQHSKSLPRILIQLLRQFGPIDALYPIELFGGFLRFVRLQMSNEVPRQRQIREGFP